MVEKVGCIADEGVGVVQVWGDISPQIEVEKLNII